VQFVWSQCCYESQWSVTCMVFVVFQMKLQSARWTSRLCLGDICYVTPLSRVCVCVDAMCCGRMYATVQMTDDTDAVICFCHLSERDGESDDWRVQEYVCDWRCVYEWTSGVCKAGWLLDESSLTCSYSFCLGWLSSHLCLMLCATCSLSYHVIIWLQCLQDSRTYCPFFCRVYIYKLVKTSVVDTVSML